jgi:V/A-type H+-transporting ATPase subunit C
LTSGASVKNVHRYAYLNARVSVMAAHLLSSAEVARTVEAPGDRHADLLRKAAFGHATDEPGERRSMEQRMISVLLDELAALARVVGGAERDFLLFWAHRFELGNLKTIIRATFARTPASIVREELVDMGPLARLPTDELLQTDDAAELLRRLEHGPYGDIARQAREVYRGQHELFAVDAAVDKRYYAKLCEHASRIGAARVPLFRELMAALLTRVNVVWLLRYRFAYGLAPMQTYYLLVPNGFRLGARALRTLVQLRSLEDVIRNLPAPLPTKLKAAASAFDVNVILEREIWRIATDALRTQFNFTRSFAYLMLRERDMQRVRAIVEGRRLAIESPQMRVALGLEEPAPRASGRRGHGEDVQARTHEARHAGHGAR